VLLAKDPVLPAVQEVDAREAVRVLAAGQLPGGTGKTCPFLNPHASGQDSARLEATRERSERLLNSVRCVVVNSAVASPESVARRLLELL
jgi:hypothetical protein